ncbi:uncharacterized protein ASPGLDRAFT_29473 [Aspergillus glaucus CBS 516.65]|uniref:Uncharacterized protein n=1 Tax=Aspergillus glaucus CBS 516.65 TaxID=1160497 RepID=A0A1L9V7V7_ASPGL|nr:hypothetical protein ASPGLDRAFT_29473 [Aspergillus glaucus CBS 516.65]OJJ79922.1 hypothetical protein ASPGLDRAFT_29473 [Aspergillus glaucus CBS 516.65]
MGSKEMPEVPWEEHFRDVDKQDNQRWTYPTSFASTPEQLAKGLNVASTYLFPNASMTISNSSDADFELISEIRILTEASLSTASCTPKYEKAPLFFQSIVRDVITGHYNREKAEGWKVWPAKQTTQ